MLTGKKIVAEWLAALEDHPEMDFDDIADLEKRIDDALKDSRELARLGGWTK